MRSVYALILIKQIKCLNPYSNGYCYMRQGKFDTLAAALY